MSARNDLLAELIALLEQIIPKITDGSDMLWGRYEVPAVLRSDLEKYINQLKHGDTSSLKNLDLLFLPTSVLQEHSIQNGWTEEYIEWSKTFDRLYKKLAIKP